ncbi:hypothetical protein RRG08_037805 [Elysia crispata]|uniref:Uncharacterized protein n=1 Tax=Elysia crispata TaxID=231223 RepID=A0AAE1EE37_9GAST|nr:hypothetical protein RRG08_037805 [Elysia crispata]
MTSYSVIHTATPPAHHMPEINALNKQAPSVMGARPFLSTGGVDATQGVLDSPAPPDKDMCANNVYTVLIARKAEVSGDDPLPYTTWSNLSTHHK